MSIKVLFNILLFIIFCACSQAQNEEMKFENNLTWEDVLQKAKAENKYIFIDCFASWCGPCKMMDREVFSQKNVGEVLNEQFISVRIQFDTTKDDNLQQKKWYSVSHEMEQKYEITGFPTYLFFSPEGKAVHKYVGALKDTDFIKIVRAALNPDKQYYTILETYRKGDLKKLSSYRYFATIAKVNGDTTLADTIARYYISDYLGKLNYNQILDKDNLNFLVYNFSHLIRSSDRVFKVFYPNEEQVDHVMEQKGLSKAIVESVIMKEEVVPRIWAANNVSKQQPDWDNLFKLISNKYDGLTAKGVILNAQIKWYRQKKDWPNLIRYQAEQIERFGLDTSDLGSAVTNNFIYNVIFKYGQDKVILNKARLWMKIIVEKFPDDYSYLDTYANLCYKLGLRKEALEWEEKALIISKDEEIRDTYDKMKSGKPTWSDSLQEASQSQ